MISRRGVLISGASSLALGATPAPFSVEEQSVASLQAALTAGRITSVGLVSLYTQRIERLDRQGPALKSVLALNPEAVALARALDDERARTGPRGPLHGIPVLLKDNLDTADQQLTTAGSRAMLDAPVPKRDAAVVARLREAGAVLLGKTNLSEWANLRGRNSTSGWSARGGLTKNPYVTTRNPSGSSSGSAVAVAASLCAVAVGTETDGSIVSPASVCGVVGFKPTLGRVPTKGVLPLAHSQDTVGPLARSVADAAVLFEVLAGADPRDPVRAALPSLAGVRLGVVRRLVDASWHVAPVAREALAAMQAAGATLVDVELSSDAYEAAELEVLLFELKADLGAYLAARGGPIASLADVVAFNRAHADAELGFFGQQLFEEALTRGPLSSPAYRAAVATCAQAGRDLEGVIKTHHLDALVAPTGSPAWLTDFVNGDPPTFSFSTPAAVAGWPHLTVPMGFVGELPVALSFVGPAFSDHTVLRLGAAFESLTHARKGPRYFTR